MIGDWSDASSAGERGVGRVKRLTTFPSRFPPMYAHITSSPPVAQIILTFVLTL